MIVQKGFSPHVDLDSWKPAGLSDHSVRISNLNHEDAAKQKELLDLLLSKQITPTEFKEAQKQRDQEFDKKLADIVHAR